MAKVWQLWRFIQRRILPVERAIAQGARASRFGDWPAAAAALGAAAVRRPHRKDILVQWGHALKESGRDGEAAAVYRRVAALAFDDVDVRLHLAMLLRRQDGFSAEVVSLYRDILQAAPANLEAMRALAEAGNRDAAPTDDGVQAREQGYRDKVTVLRADLDEAERQLHLIEAIPLAAHHEFRRRHPVPPPPSSGNEGAMSVDALVLAEADDMAAMIHATLGGVGVQSRPIGRVVVIATRAVIDHPMTSAVPTGTVFVENAHAAIAAVTADSVMIVPAGMVPVAEAAAWLTFAIARTGRGIAYSDHDVVATDWREGDAYRSPILFGRHDPLALATLTEPPVLAMVPRDSLPSILAGGGSGWDRLRALLTGQARAVHVPRLLASRYAMPPAAAAAPRRRDEGSGEPELSTPAVVGLAACEKVETIAVVVPTRDQPAMLARMIASLSGRAARPDLLQIVVIDNRSTDPAMIPLYRRLAGAGVTVVDFDQPFNWSRANNHGTAATEAPILIYANNDVEMLSPGWDDLVRERTDSSGVVGARLLYPDGYYQHAGVVFGVDRGSLSHHEGIGHRGDDAGPNGRWLAPRRAAAVTGAFMSMRRDVFDRLGGFDERLALAYNDLDLCLRARAQGLAVIYDPRLTLTHYESKTRGRNITKTQLAWDEREQVELASRWSAAALRRDPGYNPQWARGGHPFDGLREPDLSEVVDWIDAGANDPWGVR